MYLLIVCKRMFCRDAIHRVSYMVVVLFVVYLQKINYYMNTGEIVLYQPDSTIQLEVLVEDETVWLNQAQMVILFQRDVSVISRHFRNVFKEKELPMEGNSHFLQIANSDRPVAFYSLDVIISVGYRVANRFRS